MKKILFLFVFPSFLFAQSEMTTLRSAWSDSFVEWEIYCAVQEDSTVLDSIYLDDPEEYEALEFEEEICGKINLRWLQREDWTQWDYECGDESGTIRQKWRNDPSQWEVRSYQGDIISIRQQWPNDPSQWMITDNEHSFVLKSRWTSQLDEWVVDGGSLGKFYFYTLQEGDPRDWAIEDGMVEEVSPAMRIAFVFMATYISAPKQ